MSPKQAVAWGVTSVTWTLAIAIHLLHRQADEVLLNLLLWATVVVTLITVALVCYDGLRDGQRRLVESMENRHSEQLAGMEERHSEHLADIHKEVARIRKKQADLVEAGRVRQERVDEVAETLNAQALLLEQLLIDPHTRASVTELRRRPQGG